MQKINFQNLPSTTTPVNATNLNTLQTNVENAIDLKADLTYINGTTPMGNIVVDSITGKNILDLNKCEFNYCVLNNSNSTVTSNFDNFYYCAIGANYLNSFILENKGKQITFSINEELTNKSMGIVIFGTRTGGAEYQEMTSGSGERYVSGTIASDFTAVSSVELRFNRASQAFTDTTTIVSNLMLELNTLIPTTYAPYQNLNNNEYILYENDTGSVTTITLNDNIGNYKYIEVFYSSEAHYNSAKFYNANGNNLSLCINETFGDASYCKNSTWLGNGNLIQLLYANQYYFNSSGFSGWTSNTNAVKIHKVIGYK